MKKVITLLLFFIILNVSLFGSLKSPEEFSITKSSISNKKTDNPFVIPVHFLVRIYQEVFSPIKQENCRMYPSCSHYSVISLKEKGIEGIFMTIDRLNRCGHDLEYYDKIIVNNKIKYYDPVRTNK